MLQFDVVKDDSDEEEYESPPALPPRSKTLKKAASPPSSYDIPPPPPGGAPPKSTIVPQAVIWKFKPSITHSPPPLDLTYDSPPSPPPPLLESNVVASSVPHVRTSSSPRVTGKSSVLRKSLCREFRAKDGQEQQVEKKGS